MTELINLVLQVVALVAFCCIVGAGVLGLATVIERLTRPLWRRG